MSFCKCLPMEEGAYKKLTSAFLQDTQSLDEWNLLSIIDLYNVGNDLETIQSTVPFRSDECRRTKRCCGVCTRLCHARCLQDCLHRLYMWRHLVKTTPPDEQQNIPLGIRMIVLKRFETASDLSYAVGEILSQRKNTTIKEYMKNENLRPEENPYKIDYSPREALDPSTGRRIVNPLTGAIQFWEWPESGLCPYCLPEVTTDRRFGRRGGTGGALL